MNKMKKKHHSNFKKVFGDCFFDLSEISKILVRATMKTYD